MDSHINKDMYSLETNKNSELYGYTRPSDQHSQNQRSQHFLPPYAMPMSNNMPQQIMYNSQGQPMYNFMYGQSMYRNQNAFTPTGFPQPMDNVPWVSEEKYTDKMKVNTLECCTNRVDNINCPVPDMYKTANKDVHYNKLNPQWFYGNYDNQKYNELPSCSQISDSNIDCHNIKDKIDPPVKYCSIQKLPSGDPHLYPEKYDGSYTQYNKTKEYSSCAQLSQPCDLYSGLTCLEIDKKILMEHCEVQNPCDLIPSDANQSFYGPNENDLDFDVPKLDKTDETTGGAESDIVVEDSDEEVSDESEDMEKEELRYCLICNVTIEHQYYVITSENTTSFSRTKITNKLSQIFGSLSGHSVSMCGTCMTLVNTVDNLEIQLESIRRELLNKYTATMKSLKLLMNNTTVSKTKSIDQRKAKSSKYKFKNVCGLHSFKCKICNNVYSLKKFYKYHMSKHKKSKTYLCEHCGNNFKKHAALINHLRQHKTVCGVCKKLIGKNHVCKTKKDKHICHMCGKILQSKSYLKEHEYNCSGNSPYECGVCNKRFTCTTKLKNHTKLIHDKVYNETCPICSKGFVKHSDLKSHLLTHSAEKNFKCHSCEKSYKTLSNLNHHLKTHSKNLPFTCDICQKGFLRKENLEAHINFHKGVKPFSCTICDKQFSSRKNLDAHLRVHNGTNKKKVCPVCCKEISHGLTEHLRTHSNVKCFDCVGCTMKFSTKGALNKHKMRKHVKKFDM